MAPSDKDQTPPKGEISPEDREAFKRRAAELGKRLDEVKARNAPEPHEDAEARGAAMGQAMKIAIELVVGVAVGGFIGKVLDGYLGTSPWLMIAFLLLGFAAGLSNVIRTARRMQAEAEHLQRSAKSVTSDDDD